jgi:hypothetical protein
MHTKGSTWRLILISIWLVLVGLAGCRTTEIKTTKLTPVIREHQQLPESELLDVGIRIFNPGIDQDNSDEDELVFPEIRVAEASFFPYLLMETIQSSAAWGAVRVIPKTHNSVDVLVQGQIIKSDGESLSINIQASDSSGVVWFSKSYSQQASRYSYDKRSRQVQEPFQDIYNRIANDLLVHRKSLASAQLRQLHQISELQFAQSFAPQLYQDYLSVDKNGLVQISRLPAENDQMLARIKQVRERDYLFVDTLQEYYGGYAKEMREPYQQWRSESYNEVLSLKSMQRSASNKKLIGAAAIIAGILGAGNSNASMRAASTVAVAGGGYVLKDGFDRDDESQIHVEAIQELGDSFEASVASHVIELEDRTVTLSGTVDDQYQQWRKILKDIYQLDYQP